jgi:hypothetical protein
MAISGAKMPLMPATTEDSAQRSVLIFPGVRFAGRWASLVLLIAVLIPVTLSPAHSLAIRSDGVGYHLWTRAILERDLSFCKWSEESGMLISARDSVRSICRNSYPPGLALLRFPIMAPLVNLRTQSPLISPAEHRASLICGAVALVLVCWLSIASGYLLGAPAWAANFAALAFIFGTGLFHYGTSDSSFTHIYSALGFSMLVWLWLRGKGDGQSAPPWALTLVCFFLVAIRSTNLIPILLLLPVCGMPRRQADGSAQGGWRAGLAALAGAAFAASMQVAYNYYATGQLAFSTYGRSTFHFDQPMQWSVLFSYERGLFTYYPVLAVGLAAGLWARRTRWATLWLVGLIAVFVTMYGFWMSWFLGAGMGHRGFVELMPFASVIFAAALPDLTRGGRAALMTLGAVSAFVTLSIMCGYWGGTFPYVGGTQKVYWKHVAGNASLLSSRHRTPRALPDDAYSASITPTCLACSTATEAPLGVRVTVTNLSERTWPEAGVALSARFVRASDGEPLSGFDNRVPIGDDFAPHETRQFDISMKNPAQLGDYRLEVDLVQEFVAWFSNKGTKRGELAIRVVSLSLPDDAYSARIVPRCLSCPTVPGSPVSVQVAVTNLSGRTWPRDGISLSTRFVRTSDGLALSGFDNRFPIGSDFAPHESRQFTINLNNPSAGGDYRLEVDLVKEMEAWFSNKHTELGELAIHVESARQ